MKNISTWIKRWWKNHFDKSLPRKTNEKIAPSYSLPSDDLDTVVHCPSCGWSGNVRDTLRRDSTNDTCLRCGESQLNYQL